MSQKSQYNIGFQPTIINAYNCYWRSTVQYIFIAISTKTVLCKFCRICEYDLDYRFLVFIFVLLCFMVALCQLKPRWERYRIQNHVFLKFVFVFLYCWDVYVAGCQSRFATFPSCSFRFECTLCFCHLCISEPSKWRRRWRWLIDIIRTYVDGKGHQSLWY